jgi:hypothetical protein
MVYHYTDQQFDSAFRSNIESKVPSFNKDHWKELEDQLLLVPKPTGLLDFSASNVAKMLLLVIFAGALFTFVNNTPSIYASKSLNQPQPLYRQVASPAKSSFLSHAKASIPSKPFKEIKKEETPAVISEPTIVASVASAIQPVVAQKPVYKGYYKKPFKKNAPVKSEPTKESEDSYSDANIPWDESQEQSLELTDVN